MVLTPAIGTGWLLPLTYLLLTPLGQEWLSDQKDHLATGR